MADELQKKYREYAKRKRSAFRASVKKAYSIVLQSYGLEDKESSDDIVSEESEQESADEDKFVRVHFLFLAKEVYRSLLHEFYISYFLY